MKRNSVKHGILDSLGFKDAMKDFGQLERKVEEHRDTLEVVADLAKDMFCELLKVDPEMEAKEEMVGEHQIQHDLISAARETEQHGKLRRFTRGSEIHAATATISALDELIKRLPKDFKNEPQEDENGDPILDEDGDPIGPLEPGQAKKVVAAALEDATIEAEENDHIWRGWGLDPSNPKGVSPETFYQLAEQAKKSKRFQLIADMTGSMRRLAMEKQRTKPSPDLQRITGLEKGNDLSRLHNSEWNDIKDPRLRKLWKLRFIEEMMDQYKMEGEEKKSQGSIICCVDNSGSMSGDWNPPKDPFSWAMAVSVALAQVALKQRRNFVYIPFASHCGKPIEIKINDSPKVKFDKIYQMATRFMDGGTNFQAPLQKSLDYINRLGYPDGDIVFITDGIARLDPNFLKKFLEMKDEMGVSCYGISVESSVNSEIDSFCDEAISVTDLRDTTNSAAIGDIFQKL